MEMQPLRLRRHEEKRLNGGHLWIYSNEVDGEVTPLSQFRPGEQVLVQSHSGKMLGAAYVNPHSLICARLFSRDAVPLDRELLGHRLQQALSLRQRLFDQPYYRLVHGEGDLLPGLVVDRFGDHLAVQLNSAGMEALRSEVVDELCRLLQPASILWRNDSPVRTLEGLERVVEPAYGESPPRVPLIENGVRFLAPLGEGQKTGWFYDQRPNRQWLKGLVTGKRVLDVFSYIGGFAVQAAAFGAKQVTAVDASQPALMLAEENARQNGVEGCFEGLVGDAFEVLKGLREDGQRYDVVVVDPPAFIKKKKDHRQGRQAYQRINELALRLLSPDGLLLSASCSMHLDRQELVDLLQHSGAKHGVHLRLLREGMQGPDHPVHPAIAETRYLKAFLFQAGRW
jgi:23S rRNA (cytosine1962-C5)-methyltransferase